MMIPAFFVAIGVAFLFTAISVLLFRRKGPWGSSWSFFLVLFLSLWVISIYTQNVGPIYGGVAWFPILFGGVLLVILLIASMPGINEMRDKNMNTSETTAVKQSTPGPVGKIFWLLVILLLMAVLIGMVNPQPAI